MELPYFWLPKPCWVYVAHSPCRQWVMATELASFHGGHHLSRQEKSLQPLGGLSLAAGAPADPVTGLLHYKETNGGQGSASPREEPWGEEQGMDASPVHRASAILPTCHRAASSKARRTPLEGSPWHQSLQPPFYHPTLLQLSTTAPPLPRDWPPPVAGCFFLHF